MGCQVTTDHPHFGVGSWVPCWPWVPCVYSLRKARGLAPKVSRLGVAPQQIHPASVPAVCAILTLGALPAPGHAGGTSPRYSPGPALPAHQELVPAHPPWHRQDVTRPCLPSAHHPWSGSRSGTPEDLPGGSSPGLTGGCVTGTLPVAGGGRGLLAPELAAVSPFTHSIK